MAELTILYWRDIPAQVIAGRGRRAEKVVLDPRFEQAIDRAAMASGAVGTDAYLEDWRREAATGDSAEAEAARLEAVYDTARLRALIENGGHAPGTAGTGEV